MDELNNNFLVDLANLLKKHNATIGVFVNDDKFANLEYSITKVSGECHFFDLSKEVQTACYVGYKGVMSKVKL